VEEQEVRELFFERLEHLSPEAEYQLRHPDYVMEMPQSGERIRGREAMRVFQEAYPNPPSIQPRRVVGSGDVWVVEARSDYGGQIFNVAMIVEFRDGKIWRGLSPTRLAAAHRHLGIASVGYGRATSAQNPDGDSGGWKLWPRAVSPSWSALYRCASAWLYQPRSRARRRRGRSHPSALLILFSMTHLLWSCDCRLRCAAWQSPI
jgi:hypothetical protein